MSVYLLNLATKVLFLLVPLGFLACGYGLAMREFVYYIDGLLAVVVGWSGDRKSVV